MTLLVGGIDAFDPVSAGTLNELAANQHPSRRRQHFLAIAHTLSSSLGLENKRRPKVCTRLALRAGRLSRGFRPQWGVTTDHV